MATILIFVIYIAFIGLGIPDSLFGAAWPAIYQEFNIPMDSGVLITFVISFGTFASSFFSARLINKFGTGPITVVSTMLTAIALLGFSLSGNLLYMCLFSVPLGIGAGAIDSALNNYVALHYRATHMNFLHCFYGLGVTASPYLMSLALANNNNWRNGYKTAFYIQIFITLIAVFSLPLWNKVKTQYTLAGEDIKPITLSFKQMAKMRDVRLAWLIFLTSCAIEFTCGNWGSTFLVNSHDMTPHLAAKTVTFYYLGIASGRFTSGLISKFLSSWKIIKIGMSIVFFALVLMFLPNSALLASIALFLIGFGNSTVFPNLTHLTPINFSKETSQSIVSSQMAACNIGIMLVPLLFGILAQKLSTDIFPYFNMILYVVMVTATIMLIKSLKSKNKY